MKYIVLLYEETGAWPPQQFRIAMKESADICQRIHAKGQYLDAGRLRPPATATCVRVREGKRTLSDGPFAETKEQLGGYVLVDVEDLDEAIAIAASLPAASRGTAEIRPLMEVAGRPNIDSPQTIARKGMKRKLS